MQNFIIKWKCFIITLYLSVVIKTTTRLVDWLNLNLINSVRNRERERMILRKTSKYDLICLQNSENKEKIINDTNAYWRTDVCHYSLWTSTDSKSFSDVINVMIYKQRHSQCQAWIIVPMLKSYIGGRHS